MNQEAMVNICTGLSVASPRPRSSGCGLSTTIPARLSSISFFIFYYGVDCAIDKKMYNINSIQPRSGFPLITMDEIHGY
jgi:hypothetical protein